MVMRSGMDAASSSTVAATGAAGTAVGGVEGFDSAFSGGFSDFVADAMVLATSVLAGFASVLGESFFAVSTGVACFVGSLAFELADDATTGGGAVGVTAASFTAGFTASPPENPTPSSIGFISSRRLESRAQSMKTTAYFSSKTTSI